ncbi:MAG: hypothetical protein EA446_04470 [Nitrosopumilus sp.]|nr:MAG: hypothetical protein EA446_04470 [Nitrosopumilus sp.]
MNLKILFLLLLLPSSFGIAYGHTVDAVGEYRVEIGWMNEPVVSGETNAIEFYVSPMNTCPEIPEPIKCAESQEFQNGVEGLKKTVKMQLIYKDESITLPLSPDHNIPGKYYAFVNPTVSGFYQANILGSIKDTPISLSMHPPKVAERAYIEFPEPSDITVQQMIDGHTALIEDIGDLEDSVKNLEETKQQMDMGYAGIGVGIIGIAIAVVALAKSKKN